MAAGARARRRRGSGGVFSVADGVWRVDVELDPHPVTQRRRRRARTVYGTRAEAEATLAELHERPASDTRAFNVRLAAAQADALQAKATAAGRSIAAELRLAVEAWLAAGGPPPRSEERG